MESGNYDNELERDIRGANYGKAKNGAYIPLVDQDENTGHKDIFISHDGKEPITNVAIYITEMKSLYGGAGTANKDFNYLLKLGSESNSTTPNNSDGKFGGVAFEMNKAVSKDNQFSPSNGSTYICTQSRGSSIDNAIPISKLSIVGDDNPEEGVIKPGSYAHIKSRVYLPSNAVLGGKFQWSLNVIYTHEN